MSSITESQRQRSEFGSLPALQSQKSWNFAFVRGDKDRVIRLKNGNRVFSLRVDGDLSKEDFFNKKPLPLTRLGDVPGEDFLSGGDVISKGTFQVHKSTPTLIHGTMRDGKTNASVVFEVGDDGKWIMHPKPKVRLSQVASNFASKVVGDGSCKIVAMGSDDNCGANRGGDRFPDKTASLKCPECGKPPGKYRIHGDAIQCGACEKTSGMERWDKTAGTHYINCCPGCGIVAAYEKGSHNETDSKHGCGSCGWSDQKTAESPRIPKPGTKDYEIRKTMKVYAVDLDGTLAHKDKGPFDPDHIGPPVKSMLRLVRLWLRRGHEVRIFTARASDPKNIPRIKEWLKEHDLEGLEITNKKTPDIDSIYDDRAVRVGRNTGKIASLVDQFMPFEKVASEIVKKKRMVEKTDDHCPHCDIKFYEKFYPRPKPEDAGNWPDCDDHCPSCGGVVDSKEMSDEEIDNYNGFGGDRMKEILLEQREKARARKAKRSKSAVVEQEGDEWLLYTKDKSRVLGRHKKPEDAYKQEYAIKKSQERSKMASLFGHFKVAGVPIPNLGAIVRAPESVGEVANAASSAASAFGTGSGSNAIDKGVSGVTGIVDGLDLANTATRVIPSIGKALSASAPLVSKGLGIVGSKIAPPVFAAQLAYQTGNLIKDPAGEAARSHQEQTDESAPGRILDAFSNPPRWAAGVIDAGAGAAKSVYDSAKSNLGAPLLRLKHWYNNEGPGSLMHPPMTKSGGLVGNYLKILRERFLAARDTVHTSPSEAQINAGNYRKGHVFMQGLDITIENPKGSTRSGKNREGKEWSVVMKNDYGYIRNHPRSQADGDHIDVFVGPHPSSEIVFVVDQDVGGKFDEHKCMLGFLTEKEAKDAYIANFDANWKGFRSITSLTMKQFKKWISDGNTAKPLAGQEYSSFIKSAQDHDVRHLLPQPLDDLAHSRIFTEPLMAIGTGAARGALVAAAIHGIRRAKRDALDQSHKGLSLLKDLGAGAMIGAGTGALAYTTPIIAQKAYDVMDKSADFREILLAPFNAAPSVAPIMGAGYGALAGGAKGLFKKVKGTLMGEPVEDNVIKNNIVDGMAQGANYATYFSLTGENPAKEKVQVQQPKPKKLLKVRANFAPKTTPALH